MFNTYPKAGDIWTASGYENGQLVYKILKRKLNKVRSPDYNRNFREGTRMVKYEIRQADGKLITRCTSLYKFLNVPIITSGSRSFRKLAIRPEK